MKNIMLSLCLIGLVGCVDMDGMNKMGEYYCHKDGGLKMIDYYREAGITYFFIMCGNEKTIRKQSVDFWRYKE